MAPLQNLRSRGASLVVALSTTAATLVACGSDEPGGPGSPGGPTGPPGPVVRRELPLAPPSLGGLALRDVLAEDATAYPSDVVWPRAAGAAPLVLERMGRILQMTIGGPREVLDISSEVALVSEGGALGRALHPQFGDGSGPKPYAFVWYNANVEPKKQRLSRFTWSAASGAFDPASETKLLEQEERSPEHNGGRVVFGPDGFLYFGNGDDSNPDNHQRLDRALFAGIFRIDVDRRGGSVSHPPPRQPEGGASAEYFIPNDNPFVGVPGALEEYFALGLRNPFGFSFDASGALWAGDVGDTWREEVNLVVAGGNYEWPFREGELVRGDASRLGKAFAPRYSYPHSEMGDLAAIIGGFVYRGKELPELAGKYVYSDWPSGRVWALDLAGGKAVRTVLVDNEWQREALALAEDHDGEIYLVHPKNIAKLVRDGSRDALPKRLSETTLFANVADLAPEPALVPYEIASPLWSDAAEKKRWIALPPGKQVELGADGALSFPVGTRFVKHFELPASVTPEGRTRRLETRVLVVGTETTYGLTYRWNAAGTDADLLLDGADEDIREAGKPGRSWHYPSFGQCWSCHRAESRVLGFTARQLDVRTADGKDQRAELAARGVFGAALVAGMSDGLARPSDTSASLEERAAAYLAANCSSCHHEGASFLGGGPTWNASPGVALADRGLVGVSHNNRPMAERLGIPDAPLIAPGDPDGSILVARMKTADPDLRMPPIGRNLVDAEGVRVVEEWVRSIAR